MQVANYIIICHTEIEYKFPPYPLIEYNALAIITTTTIGGTVQ